MKGTRRRNIPTLFQRKRRRKSVFGVFRAWAFKALFVIVAAVWTIGMFVFCSRYSWLIEIPAATRKIFPISPSSVKNSPENVPIRLTNITKGGYESPLLIFTCKRQQYLSKTLEHVLAAISQPCGFGCPIIISEDGHHQEIEDVVLSFTKKFEEKAIPLIHIHHQRKRQLQGNPYEALAKHYGWALSQVFDGRAISSNTQQEVQQHSLPRRVVILEEDIHVAPDFFSYMESTSSLLDNDPKIYAVSAFNDNGHLEGGDPKRLLRSDFFPGLGWMMNRDLWKNELESKWPSGYWDDWLRDPDQRNDRQVIRPEVSRTYHFGTDGGASKNQFGSVLGRVKLNEQPVQWDMEDLSYLENSLYEDQYMEMVNNSKLIHLIDEAKNPSPGSNVRMEYEDFAHFRIYAARLEIMKDEKAMVPRTAYRGIVEVRLGSNLLFLVPKGSFKGYKKDTEKAF
jgi:alpha-1,3-mannosyl-glycoprotein beta-1,2-N-acetylglucosaminyltransferase